MELGLNKNKCNLNKWLVAGGSIIGLLGIVLQVIGIITPITPSGFADSNMMAILLLMILVIATTIPIMMSKMNNNEE